MPKEIKKYSLAWSADQNRGYAYLSWSDELPAVIEVTSLPELAAIGDILRNEKPVFYFEKLNGIRTDWEGVGEAEWGTN